MALSRIIGETDALRFNRRVLEQAQTAVEDLWGYCGDCDYGPVCRGGCSWTTHSLLGKRGNNPYCHHRALALQAKGIRERVEQVETAPGVPFGHGRFAGPCTDRTLTPL